MQPNNNVQVRYVPAAPKKLSKITLTGRIVLVTIWFLILLIPLFFIIMVVNGEIAVPLGEVPEHQFRVWLVSEPRDRGFGISTGSIAEQDAEHLCVQTDLRYVLWQGTESPSVYCECFNRDSVDGFWEFAGSWQTTCGERTE